MKIKASILTGILGAALTTQAAVVVTTFTGGDVGEGLDLSGDYVYAVEMGGDQYLSTVQGLQFTDHHVTSGVTVTSSGSLLDNTYYGTAPAYGDTANDNGLEAIMHSTVLAFGGNPNVGLEVAVDMNQQYELQLLFSENEQKTADSRVFDIAVEGVNLIAGFTPIPAAAAWTTAPHLGVLVTYQFTAGDTLLNVDLGEISAFGSSELQAFTLQAIPEPSAYALIGGMLALTSVMVRRRR